MDYFPFWFQSTDICLSFPNLAGNGWQFTLRQRILTHEFARATKLYDCTSDTVSLDEIEQIMI